MTNPNNLSQSSFESQSRRISPAELRKLQFLVALKHVDSALGKDLDEDVFRTKLPVDIESGAVTLNADTKSGEVEVIPADIYASRLNGEVQFFFSPVDSGITMRAPRDVDSDGPLVPLDSRYVGSRYAAFEVLARESGEFTLLGHTPAGDIVEFPPDSNERGGSAAIGKLVAVCGLAVAKAAGKEMTVV